MRYVRLPISWVLVIVFSGLISLTAGVIAWRLYVAAEASTGDTLRSMGENQLTALAKAIEAELRPAEEQARFIGDYIESGGVDVNDLRRIQDLLLGSLAASPQLIAVAFIRSDMTAISAGRDVNGQLFVTEVGDATYDALLRMAYSMGSVLKEPAWSEPVYASDMKITGLPLLTPLRKDGKLIGVIGALISTQTLARHVIDRFVDPRIGVYVLMSDGMILIHPAVANGLFVPSEGTLLPKPAAIGDPMLAAFRPELGDDPTLHPSQTIDFNVQKAEALGLTNYFLFKEMQVVGQKPWVGVLSLRGSDIDQLFDRLNTALLLSVVVWAFGCVCAYALGRLLVARPINELATAARHLSVLDFDRAQPLQRSHLTEIDVAAEAYNAMRAGLSWFETYVPRSLVPLLMRPENADSFESRERDISVLFTDIVGFTKIGQRLEAPALAAFLNRHFAILGGAVTAENGTIDKYIGDSVMAFWGAPMLQADHAERAVRAALEMRRLLEADNARRAKKGLKPVRIRIGIHCGPALAGNIGAPGRINYTLVGDTVNVAQRLEQYGKAIDEGSGDDGAGDAVIVASADVVERVPDVPHKALGAQILPGRSEPTEIYRLG